MTIATALDANVLAELRRRHQTTARTILYLVAGVILLCALAFVSRKFMTQRTNGSLDMAVRITILIFGLGAIALRRTQFAKMRLQNIAALQGASGLLVTLERTTLRVAIICSLIAVIGFAATLATGIPSYTYQSGVVAVAVLLYGYPVRNSWVQAVKRLVPGDENT